MILVLSGCSLNNASVDPEKAMTEIINEKFGEVTLLYQKNDNLYSTAIIEKDHEITLVILEKRGDSYEFFGGTSYDNTRTNYGIFHMVNDDDFLVVFAENDDFKYSNLTINYFNKTDSNETLEIKDIVAKDSYICNIYILPSDYQYNNIQLY